jgi:DegV family protein with EDD domain
MPQIAIVADSSACLPAELIERYGIIIVPLSLLCDGEVFRDGAIPPREFYARLEAARQLPHTSSAAPGEFLEAFRCGHLRGAASVLCLTLSAAYSGTHSAAVNARDLAATELPGVNVQVADTHGLAMTHGFAVLAAARAVESGASLEEAAAIAERVGSRGEMVGVLDTTRYLARSGRVPWIVHWAASLLQIKPVLAVADQQARAIARPRTMPRALDVIIDYVARRAAPGIPLHAAVMHADAPQRAEELAGRIRERFSPAELFVTEFTSVMGVHTGPGFVGVAFYREEG